MDFYQICVKRILALSCFKIKGKKIDLSRWLTCTFIKIAKYETEKKSLLSRTNFVLQLPYFSGYKTGVFLSLEWPQLSKSVQRKFAIIQILSFLNSLKNLDPYMMDLDFWACFGRGKPPFYKRRNTVSLQGAEFHCLSLQG